MASFESLSFDILFYLLDKEYISVQDIANISATSKFFNCVAKNNGLWFSKFKKCWPSIAEKYSSSDKDWKSLYKERYFYKKIVKRMLYDLSQDCYHTRRITMDDLKAFDKYTDQNTIVFIIEELESIMKDSHRHCNLTEKFYARRVLRYLNLIHIAAAWSRAFTAPALEVSFIEVACLFSRWCKPFDPDCTQEVLAQISEIAKSVSGELKKEHPEHPALKEKFNHKGVLNYSLWETDPCLDVLKCLNCVMFKDMKFNLMNLENASLDFNHFYIEKVLSSKNGSSILISVIYAAVAALLGVSCFPTLPQTTHSFLKLNVHADEEVETCTFIDIMHEGRFRNFQYMRNEFPTYPDEEWKNCFQYWCKTRDALMMCYKITNTLIVWNPLENSSRSLFMMQSTKLHECLNKWKNCILDKSFVGGVPFSDFLDMTDKSLSIINLPDVIPDLIYGRGWFPTEDFPVRQRLRISAGNYQIKYAVGMIMRHKVKNYRCVIYSWDQRAEMMVYNYTYRRYYRYPNARLRPHYRVLVDDDDICYVSQESLEIDFETEPIKNWRVGKYFESFHGSYYMPNKMTRSIYSEDVVARQRALRYCHRCPAEQHIIILDD